MSNEDYRNQAGYGQPDEESWGSDDLEWDAFEEDSNNSTDSWEDNSSYNQDSDDWDKVGNTYADFSSEDEQPSNNSDDDYWQKQYRDAGEKKPRIEVNFNKAQIGIILVCVFLALAIFLFVIDNVHISKNTNVDASKNYKEESTTSDKSTTDKEEKSEENEISVSNVKSSELIEVPSSTSLDYSSDVSEINATVSSKDTYLYDNQLVYSLKLSLGMENSSVTANYFCSFEVFKQVNIGDTLTVRYQEPETGYISINEVIK